MGHACEWETSMMLASGAESGWRPGQVEPVSCQMPFEPASQAGSRKSEATPGHIGDPRQATAAKGDLLFRLFSQDVVTFLERVIRWDGRSWDV